ncbi:MAG: hypothetical protein K4571_04475 [Deltaproteobacteria bacterium]
MIKISYYLFIMFLGLLVLNLCSCGYLQKRLDIAGLAELADDITPDADTGSPEKLQAFVEPLSLRKDTEPDPNPPFTVGPLNKWPMKLPQGGKLIMEKISFPSQIRKENGKDRAVFYIYRTGELKDKKVILWVPGAGVSDFAFHFIKCFFLEALTRNYNIVFYVPPYHLERKEAGKKNGEGLLMPDHKRNVSVLLDAVRELRTMISYLRSNGVTKVGGWGGSIGATMLLLTEQMEEFDHLNIMIPVIDFDTVIFKNRQMSDTVAQFRKAGFSEDLLKQAYGIVNPINYPLKIDPGRVQMMYAEYDQLTPESATVAFARKNNIKKIVAYPRSHATMLLASHLYEDYGLFLDSLELGE